MSKIQPLTALMDQTVRNSWVKQRVTNVIKSYHNAADVLAEPIQNAVDEVLAAEGVEGLGEVTVILDTDRNRISVVDNGRGIPSKEIEKYLAPDMGTKRKAFQEGWVRGHKGVGMTFLAYGFDFFEVESRTMGGEHYRVLMEGGRTWVADDSDELAPPVGNLQHLTSEGTLASHGTRVTIGLGPKTEPRDLKRAFPNSEFAAVALQNQTAIGVVEPPRVRKKRDLTAQLQYISNGRLETVPIQASYRYPHKSIDSSTKVLDLDAWFSNHPMTEPKVRERKAYHACHATFDSTALKRLLRDQVGQSLTTTQEIYEYIDAHRIHVYAMFSNSASYRDRLAEIWNVPKNRVLHAPRLRVATDGMISSWSREVTLTHRGFHVDRTWLIYQLSFIEPDMGRKDFPPELHDFLHISEERIANEIARLSSPFLRPSARRTVKPMEGYVEPAVKANDRLRSPLRPSKIPGFDQISLQTIPESEQDVIALFNELVGLGVLRHLKPVFYSGFDHYDSFLEYKPDEVSPIVKERMPGEFEIDPRDGKGVAEFKHQGDWILDDIVTEVKRWEDIKFLICWKIGNETLQKGGDEVSFRSVDDPVDRRFHGVTHLASLQSAGSRSLYVISLSDLLEILCG